MKQKISGIVRVAGLLVVLVIMYGSEFGIPGIERYWDGFKLLDMQFTYSKATVEHMMAMLGEEGIQHYLYYFIVDFFFIGALGCVQLQISKNIANTRRKYGKVLCGLVIGRAVLDLCEDALLSLILKNVVSFEYVTFASAITSLNLWGIALISSKGKK